MGKPKCMNAKKGKPIQAKCRMPTRIQPKRGKLAQTGHGKPLDVKPKPRKPKRVHSRSPKFIQRRRRSHIQHRRRRSKCNEKQLTETTKQPNATVPVSLRIQIKIAIKKSLEDDYHCLSHGLHNNCTALHDACRYGHEKVVKSSHECGAEVNIPHPTGEMPLFDAVTAGNSKIFKYLIDHGANTQLKDV